MNSDQLTFDFMGQAKTAVQGTVDPIVRNTHVGRNLTRLERVFAFDRHYIDLYEQCLSNTPPLAYYRVIGPAKFEHTHKSGSMSELVAVDNDMLGKIIRPIIPNFGSLMLSGGKFYVEVITGHSNRVVKIVDKRLVLKNISNKLMSENYR